MASIETKTILIKNNEEASSEGTLHLAVYDHNERVKRAVIALLGFWLLAVVFIPIMIVHLVAIPLFLVLGPVFAYKRYHAAAIPKEVTGRCPTCGEELKIVLEPSDRLPMWSYCSAHNDPIQLLEIT